MDEPKLTASPAAGEISAPQMGQTAPFSATFREKTAAFLMYLAAYLYIRTVTSPADLFLTLLPWFVAVFIAMTEFLFWDTPRPAESWLWLGCLVAVTVGILLQPLQVWDEYALMFLHLFAVWWALSRSGRLLEGKSGRLVLFDAVNGFVVFPFKHFFLRIRTVFFTLTHLGKRRRRETILWAVLAVAAAGALFAASASLLMAADRGFARLFDVFGEFFASLRWDAELLIRVLLSLPVGAWLFGLLAGTGREDIEAVRAAGRRIDHRLGRLRKVPLRLWLGLCGVFCLLYLVFFIVQGRYLFGAFTRTLPEGFIVSEYARQGFFELCKVMGVNFVLLWLLLRTSREELKQSRAGKGLCLVLLLESFLFAVVAFSKLALYISCFGFTPLRLQSSWLVCVLAFGCLCAAVSLFTEKRPFRLWMLFAAVTLALLHLY